MKISKALQKTAIGLLAGAGTGLGIFLFSQIDGFSAKYLEQLERVFYDLTFKFNYVYTLDNLIDQSDKTVQADSTIEPRIQVIDIDERALAKLGSYNTWPRKHHASVVDYLSRGGASSITFDILFKNADFGAQDTKDALEVLKQVKPEENWEQFSPAIRSAYNHDSLLVRSVKEAGNVVICATMAPRKNYEHKSQWEPLSTAEWQAKIGTKGTLDSSQIPQGASTVWDLLDNVFPELANATPYLGLVNVIPDDDGVHRKEPLFHGFPNPELAPNTPTRYYSLITIQTVALLFGLEPTDIKIAPGEFVDLGQPLGVYRDTLNTLRSTYPNLTWPMLRALHKNRSHILALESGTQAGKSLEITHQVIVDRDRFNDVTAEINDAQTLTAPMVRAILYTPSFDSLYQLAHSQIVKLNDTVTLDFDPEAKQIKILDLVEEEEANLTDYGVTVLREGASEIAALKPEKRLYLSSNLDVRWDPSQEKLVSSFIILSPGVLHDFLYADLEKLEALLPGTTVRFGPRVKIPVDEELHMQVNYIGQYDTKRNKRAFKQISYYELVSKRVDPGSFQGKVFILGSTAPALFDLVSAPHEAEYPGVLIHATILENVLNGNFLEILKDHNQLWVILGLALFCAILSNMLPPAVGFFVLLLVSIAYFLIGLEYFEKGVYIGNARQILTIFLSYIVIIIYRFVIENREKRFLDRTFKQYVSPELIEEMKASEEPPVLGGQEIVGTAYFTDIAGFSSFTEAIGSPEKLVELLNEYLGAMTNILTSNRGTLDKYIGDAIVAIFGAPVKTPDHALRACTVGLLMQTHLLQLRQKWISEGNKWPKLVHKMHMRIGINTGKMVVGNMGSEMRKNYTMMGDTVNLAARLESAAKQYGVYVQVADETLQAAGPENFISRPIDRVVVMGKTEPVLCHELLGLQKDALPELSELVLQWEKAQQAYIDMRWTDAIKLFEQCLPLEPHHPDKDPGSKNTPSDVYIKRCKVFQEVGLKDKEGNPWPAGKPWDGVYVATSK